MPDSLPRPGGAPPADRHAPLLDVIDAGFALCEMIPDAEGRLADFVYLETNPAFERHTGMHGAVGRRVSEFVPNVEESWIGHYRRVVETGEGVRFEAYVAGLGQWFDVYAFPRGGRRFGTLFTDVTERKRAEEALRESEARYRALAEATAYSLYRMSPDWSEMLRLDGRGFIADTPDPSKGWLETYIHEDDRPDVLAAIGEAIRARRMFEMEHRVRRVDGTLGWTLSRAVPLLDERGEVTEWVGAASDVTARKEAELALRESVQRTEFTLDTAGSGDWDLDLTTGEAVTSLRHDRCFGATEPIPDWSYGTFLSYVHPDDREREDRRFREAIASGEDWHVDCRVVWPDGSVRWIESAGRNYRHVAGRPTRMLGMVRDVTARKEGEARLRESEERQAFLLRLSDGLRPLADPVEIQAEAARVLGLHLGADQAHYGETAGDHVVIHQGYGDGLPPMVGRFRAVDFGERLVAAYRAGQTVVSDDTEADLTISGAEREVLAAAGIRAYVAVPLVKGGAWVATLAVHSTTPRGWTPAEIALVQATAERTWEAIERAYSDAALAESEEKYRSLFEMMEEGFAAGELLRDEAGRVVDYRLTGLNPAFERHSGLRREDVLGRPAREVLPTIEPSWIETCARVVETGESAHFERYMAPLGRWYRVRVFPRGEDRFAFLYDDVTARKEAEASLAASEARFRRALTGAAVPVMMHAEDGEVLAVSDALVEITGWARDEIPTTADWTRRAYGRRAAQVDALVGRAFRREQAIAGVELDVHTRAGQTRRWVFHGAPPERAPDGRRYYVVLATDITDRVQAEAALREREERLRLIFESAEDYAVLTFDAQGRVQDWNTGAERILGYAEAEIVGRAGEVLFTPEDRAAGEPAGEMRRAQAEGCATDERWHVRKDGSRFWGSGFMWPLHAEGGTHGYLKIMRDDTRRRVAELALRESEERYRLLIESAREYAVVALDPEGRITLWSGGAERLFAWEQAQAVGQPFEALFTPEDRAADGPAHEMQQARQHGHASDDRQHLRKDGSRFWATGVLTAVRHPDGTLRGFVKILRDNTLRREAEDALRRSEEWLRLSTAAASIGLWDWDLVTGRIEWSPRHNRLLGLPEAQREGSYEGFMGAVHPEDRADVAARLDAAARTGHDYEAEYRAALPDGQTRWILGYGRCDTDGDGRRVRMAGTVQDVTARKVAEHAVRTLNQTLEGRVAERTAQVQALTAYLMEAEERERKRLALVLHDDLQQQLYGLRIALSLLRDTPEPAAQGPLLDQADQTAARVIALARSLANELDPPVLDSEDVRDLLGWIAEQKRDQHGLALALDAEEPCLVPSRSVRALLHHALSEVLFNVVKHAGVDRATLRARCAGAEVFVSVEDAGVGFDPHAGGRGAGGGLGLHSVRERIEMAGGRFEVVSAPGRGTRTTLILPTGVPGADAPPDGANPEPGPMRD